MNLIPRPPWCYLTCGFYISNGKQAPYAMVIFAVYRYVRYALWGTKEIEKKNNDSKQTIEKQQKTIECLICRELSV